MTQQECASLTLQAFVIKVSAKAGATCQLRQSNTVRWGCSLSGGCACCINLQGWGGGAGWQDDEPPPEREAPETALPSLNLNHITGATEPIFPKAKLKRWE